MRTTWTSAVLIGCLGLGAAGGCEAIQDNPRTAGTAIGALAGAGVGAAVGGKEHRTEGALIGGAAGAGGGWLVGDQADKRSDNNDRKRERAQRARYYDDDRYGTARSARYSDRYDRSDSYDRYDRYDRYSDGRYD